MAVILQITVFQIDPADGMSPVQRLTNIWTNAGLYSYLDPWHHIQVKLE